MFGIGIPELILILLIAFILLGPKKLSDIIRTIGKSLHAFKEALGANGSSTINELDETRDDRGP